MSTGRIVRNPIPHTISDEIQRLARKRHETKPMSICQIIRTVQLLENSSDIRSVTYQREGGCVSDSTDPSALWKKNYNNLFNLEML